MSRAGREPAEDVKRRLIHACEQADLHVQTARMYLRRNQGGRLVMVSASPDSWPHAFPMVSLYTMVGINGDWSGGVDIRCTTAESDAPINVWDTLVMQGRDRVPYEDLARQLKLTMDEREQVVAAVKLGIEGPYWFEHARWETPACMR